MAKSMKKSTKASPVVDFTSGDGKSPAPLGASFARAGFTRVAPGNHTPPRTSRRNVKNNPTLESLGALTSENTTRPVIIDERITDKGHQYLVQYDSSNASFSLWEHEQNLIQSSGLIAAWKQKQSDSMSGTKRTTRKRNASFETESSSVAKRGKDKSSPGFSPAGSATPQPETPALGGLKPLSIWDVLFAGRKDGSTTHVINGVVDKIPPPKPNLPQVVSHPDYIAFQRKLNAIALPGAPITLSNEFHANRPSPPLDFEFIDHLRYGRGIEPYDINFATFCGCSSGRCSSNATCSCVRDSEDQAVEMRYNEQGLLKDSGNDRAIYECNDNCGCEPDCLNHVVGRGRRVPIDVFMTKDKGWGLRSPYALKAGTFIGKYTGEVITHEEATGRANEGNRLNSSYLFDLDYFDLEEGEKRFTIDGRECGDITRFVNHSCDPNLLIYSVLSTRRDGKIYDLAMFTKRDIRPWEELTFSYIGDDHFKKGKGKKGDEKGDEKGDGGEEKSKPWPCHCGAYNCRKWLW